MIYKDHIYIQYTHLGTGTVFPNPKNELNLLVLLFIKPWPG
jgi:hypothetical protein